MAVDPSTKAPRIQRVVNSLVMADDKIPPDPTGLPSLDTKDKQPINAPSLPRP